MFTSRDAALERAILDVLVGADPHDAAPGAGMRPDRLATLASRYRAGGRHALEPDHHGWTQIDIEFTAYDDAVDVFHSELWPVVRRSRWWFVRKSPHWRLRLDTGRTLPDALRAALDSMTTHGALRCWRQAIYEPETAAFGGPAGLQAAHDVHAADSTGLLVFLDRQHASGTTVPQLPVASLMVLAHLMRAAGLEWAEQGDVWDRVQGLRPPALIDDDAATGLAAKARIALAADLSLLVRDNDDVAAMRPWATRMHDAGRHLVDVAADGELHAGLRTVLARTVLFCWNRAGFTTQQQSVWASAARRAVLG